MTSEINETQKCDVCGQEIIDKLCTTAVVTEFSHINVCAQCWEKQNRTMTVPGFKWVAKGEKGNGVEPGVLD